MTKSRISVLILTFVLAPLAMVVTGERPTQAGAPAATPVGERPGRDQFGAVASGAIVVWEDRLNVSNVAQPEGVPPKDLAAGTSDIYGTDLATNRTIVVSNGPGDQAAPAISGTLVVWQDSRHSCPTCELDILGRDIATGADFSIATGPADQSYPAVAGSTVVWIENDGTRIRLLGMNLDTKASFEIAVAADGSTFGRPAMSDDLVVWSEITPEPPYSLHAYDMETAESYVIAESNDLGLEYDVEGTRIVSSGLQLTLTDVSTGESRTLHPSRVAGPVIDGAFVVWSAPSVGTASQYDVYGLELATSRELPLVVASANQRNPLIANDTLLWQSEENGGTHLESMELAEAVANGLDQLAAAQVAEIGSSLAPDEVRQPLSHDTSFTRPTRKGLHTANGGGWLITYNGSQQACNATSCPAVDSLGAPGAPFFGSFLVIDYDLNRDTGRDTPMSGTNRTVANWMKYYQSTYSNRPVLRIHPTRVPMSNGTITPDTSAQDVVGLASSHDWIKHLQVENEPNLEWPNSCTSCKWTSGGQQRTYTWSGLYDYRKYQAINTFYTDVWWALDYYKNNHSNATVRARLQAMEFWTPPMADFYRTLDNGQNFYNYLQGMIGQYDRMAYHTYPNPFDDGSGGGILNNSWPWFNSWVQSNVNSGALRTMITEFGWNPGRMDLCGYGQNSTWPATGTCPAKDAVNHRFENDLSYFLANQRHNAEAVHVWIVKGWSTNADGLTSTGTVKQWLHYYQWSNP